MESQETDASPISTNNNNNKPMNKSPYFDTNIWLPLAQVVDSKSQSGATIFQNNDNIDKEGTMEIVVACRGSANWANFVTNLQFQLVPVEKPFLVSDNDDKDSNRFDRNDLLIHTGFQEAAKGLWTVLGPELNQILRQKNNNSNKNNNIRLVFTGHSLGAATALLCAVQYCLSRTGSETYPVPARIESRISIVTFGGPRLVNQALADYWMTTCFSSSPPVNFIHSKDPILQQNQPLWDALGFLLVGKEIVCEPNTAVVYPDKQRIDKSVFVWNFLDHCPYLGVFVGPRLFA
jgi:hypothetical protein